jgi:hypothetical protein
MRVARKMGEQGSDRTLKRGALRVMPAIAAGVTDRLWEIGDIVKLLEVTEA